MELLPSSEPNSSPSQPLHQAGESSPPGQPAVVVVPIISPAEQVQGELQAATSAFNETPQYALTAEDLALLESQGMLGDDDSSAIASLAAQPAQ